MRLMSESHINLGKLMRNYLFVYARDFFLGSLRLELRIEAEEWPYGREALGPIA